MLWGASPAMRVTIVSSAAYPCRMRYGGQGDAASFSAKQNVYFAGLPWVERSITRAIPPPTLLRISRNARPIVALGRDPCPKQFPPALIPRAPAPGPLTMIILPHGWVVAWVPCKL